ncbi:MAG TPA: helix-turn-helix domain-containing protein [Pyrinomonadaceae bacterium]|nr:helix-turn-helix domain-containing protein [Pyrinomonadaceae bacterium]
MRAETGTLTGARLNGSNLPHSFLRESHTHYRGRLNDRNFSLYGAVHDLEARFIEQALDAAGGSVTKAARRLGISHQSLTLMLDTRHKKLQKKRTPAKKRKRSIIQKQDK